MGCHNGPHKGCSQGKLYKSGFSSRWYSSRQQPKAIQEMGYPKHVGGMFSEETDDCLSNAVHFGGVERGSVHNNSLILALCMPFM